MSEAVDVAALDGKRVLLVINELRWFFSHRLALANALRKAGACVGVVAPPASIAEDVRMNGFEYHPVDLPRNLQGIMNELGAPLRLARLYQREQPDLVHHVTTKPVLYGSHAARMVGVPAVVNTIAGLGYLFMSDALRARALRACVRAAYRVALAHRNSVTIFQNQEDRDAFLRSGLITRSRAALIHGSGVDTDQFTPVPEPAGVPVVMLVSRMLRDKGVGDFVEAARILKARSVACRCVLVGSPDPGNPTSIGQDVLAGWQNAGVIEWWGERSDIPTVMAGANLVVLPSYREGLPKVLLEAAASARAIITNDVPGCRDTVEPGQSGLLVPPRDPAALATAIERLLADPVGRRAMGRRGRALVEERFAQDIVLRQTLRIYTTLLGSGSA